MPISWKTWLPVNPAPGWMGNALLSLVMLLTALAMRRFRPVISALAAGAFMAAVAGLSWVLFVHASVWLPVGITLLGVLLLYIAQAIVAFIMEREQRLMVKRMFSRYVPEAVVEQLAAHPERLKLGGEHREVTLMFTDLAGFTTLAEEMAPERAADLLNRCKPAAGQLGWQRGARRQVKVRRRRPPRSPHPS